MGGYGRYVLLPPIGVKPGQLRPRSRLVHRIRRRHEGLFDHGPKLDPGLSDPPQFEVDPSEFKAVNEFGRIEFHRSLHVVARGVQIGRTECLPAKKTPDDKPLKAAQATDLAVPLAHDVVSDRAVWIQFDRPRSDRQNLFGKSHAFSHTYRQRVPTQRHRKPFVAFHPVRPHLEGAARVRDARSEETIRGLDVVSENPDRHALGRCEPKGLIVERIGPYRAAESLKSSGSIKGLMETPTVCDQHVRYLVPSGSPQGFGNRRGLGRCRRTRQQKCRDRQCAGA